MNRILTPTNTLDRMTIAVDARVRKLVDLAARPRVKRVLRIAERLSVAAILAFFVFGVVMVATMLRWGYVAPGVERADDLARFADRFRKQYDGDAEAILFDNARRFTRRAFELGAG